MYSESVKYVIISWKNQFQSSLVNKHFWQPLIYATNVQFQTELTAIEKPFRRHAACHWLSTVTKPLSACEIGWCNLYGCWYYVTEGILPPFGRVIGQTMRPFFSQKHTTNLMSWPVTSLRVICNKPSFLTSTAFYLRKFSAPWCFQTKTTGNITWYSHK